MIYGARLFAGLLAAGLLFAPMSAGADDLKIVPGERIGDVSVNMSIEEVLRILGNPSSVDRNPRFATYEWRSRLIRVAHNLDSGRVEVRTFWMLRVPNSYRTDAGLGIGSTIEQIRQVFGDQGCVARSLPNQREWWWLRGIAFFIGTDPGDPPEIRMKTREIAVRRPALLLDRVTVPASEAEPALRPGLVHTGVGIRRLASRGW